VSLRSPLGRVLGRGASGHGVQDWWHQRVGSVALVPLTIWFLVSLLSLPTLDRSDVAAWIAGGWTPVFLSLLVLTAAHHSQLGIRVIVEDYVHHSAAKTITLLVAAFVHALLAVAGLFAILKIAFGAAG
jgi:succinate dehydrogenase / fumarate reductase, membrane anchor subunit